MRIWVLAVVLWSGCEGDLVGIRATDPSEPRKPPLAGDQALGGGQGTNEPPAAGGSGGGSSEPSRPSACAIDRPPSVPLQRLTRYEYRRTLEALFGSAVLTDGPVSTALEALTSDLSDSHHPATAPMQVEQVRATLDVSLRIGALLTTNAAMRAAADVPGCVTTAMTQPCLTQVVTSFGARVFRRPLSADERTEFTRLFTDAPGTESEKLQMLYASMLSSPAALYHLEPGGAFVAGSDRVVTLSDWELANRLSYGLWGVPPDAELSAHAAAGDLASEAVLRAQVLRLFDAPQGRAHLTTSLAQWLDADVLPAFSFSSDFLQGQSLDGVRDAMRTELRRYLQRLVWDRAGTYRELMTSPESIVEHPGLAAIYGVTPAADGSVRFLPAQRRGVLGKGAVLDKVGQLATNVPIKRGVFVFRQLLCQSVGRPDQAQLPPGSLDPIPLPVDVTLREGVHARTSQGVCAGCHAQFNPLGFALESFDPLGRHRERERIFDAQGRAVKEVALDASATVTLDGVPVRVSGAAALAEAIGASRQGRECFTTRWIEQIAKRDAQPNDACLAERLQLTPDRPLRESMIDTFTDRAFRQKTLGAP